MKTAPASMLYSKTSLALNLSIWCSQAGRGMTITMSVISSPIYMMGANPNMKIYIPAWRQDSRYKYLRQKLPGDPNHPKDHSVKQSYQISISNTALFETSSIFHFKKAQRNTENALATRNNTPARCPQRNTSPRRAGGVSSLERLNLQHSRRFRRARVRRRLLFDWKKRRGNLQRSQSGWVQSLYLRRPGVPARRRMSRRGMVLIPVPGKSDWHTAAMRGDGAWWEKCRDRGRWW